MTSRFVLPLADVGAGITPSSGAQLFFYETGTTTPKDTYSDAAGTTPNANPVVANSVGVFPDIFISGTYKVVLKNTDGVQQWAADPVTSDDSVYVSKTELAALQSSTLAEAVANTDLQVGQAISISDRGYGVFDVVLASGVTPNTYNIVQCTGVGTLALVLRYGNVMRSKQVGIIGDGTTDFTTAINSMLTVISSAGGGEFVIEKSTGSYKINAATGIKPNGNTKLTIEKNAVVEAITNALPDYAVIQVSNADNVTISGGGTVQGERTTHTGGTGEGGMCIRMDNSTNVTIEDLEITEGWGDGIYVGGVGGQCSNITIRKNRIHNNRRNNISVVDGAKGVITENLIYNANGTNPEAGIDLEPGYQENVTDWTVSNNVLWDNNGGGIAAVTPWGPLISTVRNITIVGNVVEACGNGASTGYGIAAARMLNCNITGNTIKDTDGKGLVIGSGGHKIDLVPNSVAAITSGINATGNNITGSTSHGIFLDAAQSLADLSNILVSGNTSNNNAGGGIYCSKTSGQTCQDITLSGNTTKNNTLSGIYFNRVNDVNISGNTSLGNAKDGIEIDGSASDTFGYLIASNLIKGNTESGIQAWYTNRSAITGNKIIGNGEEGIYSFDGHDSTITANEISGNGQTTDATYNGVWLNRSDDCVVSGNLIRHGGGANQQKYGIEIEATAERNLVTGNNIVSSGKTGSILDSSGTSTVNNNLV